MTTKSVTTESSDLERLIQEGRTATQPIIHGIQRRSAELSVQLTTDLGKFINEVSLLATAAAGSARQGDAAAGAQKLHVKAPSQIRDEAATSLTIFLRATKVAMGARFGAVVDQVFPSKVPEHPKELFAYGAQVVQAVQRDWSTWQPVRNVVPLDVPAALAQLQQLLTQLKNALDQVALEGSATTATLHDRDGVATRMHQIHKGLLSLLVGLLELAGEPDRADSLAIHHHTDRNHHPATPTPPAPTP